MKEPLWRHIWFDRDKADRIRKVIESGWEIRADGQVSPTRQVFSLDIPWIFIGQPEQPECALWTGIYWPIFGLVPEFCRNKCHKVVAYPRTVKELFDLYVVMRDKIGWPSKCGVDRRSYTSAPYAAFFYNSSLEAGKECYRTVREAIDAHLPDGKGIKVLLKKGCTEMEDPIRGGTPTDTWVELSDGEEDLQAHLDGIFYHGTEDGQMSDWHKRYIQFRWLQHAYSIGDQTWKEIIDGDPFGVRYKTYEKERAEERREVKEVES